MARTIATVTGIALAPGVSRNGRLYTEQAIGRAVARAQQRIAEGKRPIAMYTDHDTRKVTDIAGGLTRVWQDEDGVARYEAAITDTRAGRDIIALADPGPDGKQAILRGLSIKGDWVGRTRQVRAGDGRLVSTADDLEIARLDWTTEPGVDDAGVERFELAAAGSREDAGLFGIAEAAPDAELTIAEDAGEAQVTVITGEASDGALAPPAELREAFSVMFGALEAVEEADTPALPKRDSGLSGGGRQWADPGYLKDKKQRYDISSKAKAKSAWSYINQKANAAQYSPNQLKRIKGRIKAALKGFGVQVAAEGWTIDSAFQVTEAIAEYMGDPDTCGSYSLSATNGPTTVTVCSYGLDPADLAVILQRACDAAGAALCALDPDMDGDIDVPGADAEDTDDDAGDDMDNGDGTEDLVRRLMSAVRGESAGDLDDLITEARNRHQQVTETAPQTTAPGEAAAAPTDEEGSAVSETTVQEAATAPAAATFSQADVEAAVAKALAAHDEARRARKAAKKAQAAESTAGTAAAVQESTHAAPAVSETETLERLVQERLNARLAAEGLTESLEQKVERLVEARVTEAKQDLVTQGAGPSRKGLVTEHSAAKPAADGVPADFPMGDDGMVLPMEKWSPAHRAAVSDVLQRTYLPYLAKGE